MALTKVSSSLVSDSAVTSGKIADGGVATADIATNAVTSTKIAQNSILTKHIDDGQVTTDQLGADAVTAAKIADDAISEEHLDITVITSLTAVTAATGDLLMVADVSDSNNLKKIPVSSILAGTHTGAVNTSGTINSGALGVTGNIAVSGTVDGIDIAARDAVLTSTTTTAGAALPKAGGTMTGNLTVNAIVDADNFKINNAQGTDGQVLTSTGSGVAWEDSGYSGGNFEITNADQDNGVVLTLKNTYNGSSWANGDIGGAINFTSSDAGVTQPIRAQIKTVTANALGDPYPFYTDMVFSTTTLNNSTTERMRIDYLGRVGIGTATPGTNHAKANKLVVGSGSAGGMAIFNGTAEGWYAFSRANANNTDAYDGGMSYNGDRDLKFHTNAGATRMTIDGSGNVGIGTSSPTSKLHLATTGSEEIGIGLQNSQRYYGIQTTGGALTIKDVSAGGTERLRIDSSGRVGIGTASPQTSTKGLHVVHDANEGTPSFPDGEVIIAQRNFNSSQGCHIGIIAGSAGESAINFGDKDDSDIGNITYNHAANRMEFITNAAERMRIDNSGNLLVGTASTTVGGATSGKGFRVDGASGIIQAAASGNTSAIFNRTSSDGAIVSLRKNGALIGSIGTQSDDITIGNDNVGLRFGYAGLSSIVPVDIDNNDLEDGILSLGHANARFKDLFLSGGVHLGGSGSANKLDDYEEGTWTPDLRNGGTSLSTQTWQYGPTALYTKIGDLVYIHLSGKLSGVGGTSTGELRIFGLPFSGKPTGGYQEFRMNFFLGNQPNTADSYQAFAFVRNNGVDFGTRLLSGGDTIFTSNRLDNDTFFTIFGCYKTNN